MATTLGRPFGAYRDCAARRFSPSLLPRCTKLECALASSAPGFVTALRERLGRNVAADAPPAEQPTPHVTMFHMGLQRPGDLRRLPESIWSSVTVDACLDRFGVFRTAAGRVKFHISLAPRDVLKAAQRQLVRAAAALRTQGSSVYVGRRFSPHVSVWDEARLVPWIERATEGIVLLERSFRLRGLDLIGREPRM